MTELKIEHSREAYCNFADKFVCSLVPPLLPPELHLGSRWWDLDEDRTIYKREFDGIKETGFLVKHKENTYYDRPEIFIFTEEKYPKPLVERIIVKVDNEEFSELGKKIALTLAKHLDVILRLPTINSESAGTSFQGSINCQYCNQITHNLEKCDHCGGKPI
jgi:hypothetical protein